MNIKNECDDCTESTKFVQGMLDGVNGTHGFMFSCHNDNCSIKQLEKALETKSIQDRMKIQGINASNDVYAGLIKAKRRDKGVTIRKLASDVGVPVVDYSDYENERKPIPKAIYLKVLEFVGGRI